MTTNQVTPPEGYRLLRCGTIIRDGDIFTILDGDWEKRTAQTIGKKITETFAPTARKIEKEK